MIDLQFEYRPAPIDPALVAAAKRQPNGWAYQIDWPYPETERTPSEAIRGGWQVAADGRLTDVFAPNPRYRAIERCDRAVTPVRPNSRRGASHDLLHQVARSPFSQF